MWLLNCFSNQYGRISFSAFPKKSSGFSPFSLIEASITLQTNDFALAREVEIIDTFVQMRSHEGAAKSALLLRAIIEKCLPMRAPSEDIWKLFLSLLEMLPSFHDWRAAPLLLALTFFEHEGVSPRSITELSSLSDETKKIAKELIESDEVLWKTIDIPDELFLAALETIGVEKDAKGGT